MKMKLLGGIFCGLFLVMTAQSANAATSAALLMTNVAKITAANSTLAPTDFTNITVATMFGGSAMLSNAYYQSISTFQRFVWTINVTNFGNATAKFVPKVVFSNNRSGGGTWSYHFNNANNITNLSPSQWGSLQFVITNITLASNGAFNSYLVKFSNTRAPQTAKGYFGIDGTWYGGTLGLSTNAKVGSVTNTAAHLIGPIVYLQFPTTASNYSGFMKAIISAPQLNITKWISGIFNPYSGLTLNGNQVIPGSQIAYRIKVTNSGSVAATSVKIIDSFSTNFLLVSVTNGGIFTNYLNTTSGALSVMKFSNYSSNRLSPGRSDIIKIVVKVK